MSRSSRGRLLALAVSFGMTYLTYLGWLYDCQRPALGEKG
jgi:hypothetical protein